MLEAILTYKFRFLAAFFVIFSLTYGVLFALDALPEPPSATDATSETPSPTPVASSSVAVPDSDANSDSKLDVPEPAPPVVEAALPHTLVIDALDRTLDVANPQSRAIADLDAALLESVVRHPDSATLTTEGNVFILGHSSYLPTVRNSAYRALNGIQDLRWGDTLRLRSDDAEHVYRVDRVYEARATDVTVPIADTGAKLTLATCDSFGSIDDRFIVEASRISVHPL